MWTYRAVRYNKKTARVSDPSHWIAQVDFLRPERLSKAGENKRVCSSDEDQTRVRFYIYHIYHNPPQNKQF
jgi:hypothetical protein